MGQLVDGKWSEERIKPKTEGGRFVRRESVFRNWITRDGSPGPTGNGGFKADTGRYHLYICWACPWAHRTLIFRTLKKLENHISFSVVSPFVENNGWQFDDTPGSTEDHLFGTGFLHEVYVRADPTYTGPVTVPVLWDKHQNTMVNNESSEIIRMLNTEFADFTDDKTDYYPEDLRVEIDEVNDAVFNHVNNGVYKSGFAKTQEAYDEAVTALFETLDDMEQRLANSRYLAGDALTEADWRFFPTLIRFDHVYNVHFKCNIRRLQDYPNLWNYTRELYQVPGIAETVNMDHNKLHYYWSHTSVNPLRLIPVGPDIDFDEPHDRKRVAA